MSSFKVDSLVLRLFRFFVIIDLFKIFLSRASTGRLESLRLFAILGVLFYNNNLEISHSSFHQNSVEDNDQYKGNSVKVDSVPKRLIK